MKISYFADREAAERGWSTFLRICFALKQFFYIAIIGILLFLKIEINNLKEDIEYEAEKFKKLNSCQERIYYLTLKMLISDNSKDVELAKKNIAEKVIELRKN